MNTHTHTPHALYIHLCVSHTNTQYAPHTHRHTHTSHTHIHMHTSHTHTHLTLTLTHTDTPHTLIHPPIHTYWTETVKATGFLQPSTKPHIQTLKSEIISQLTLAGSIPALLFVHLFYCQHFLETSLLEYTLSYCTISHFCKHCQYYRHNYVMHARKWKAPWSTCFRNKPSDNLQVHVWV